MASYGAKINYKQDMPPPGGYKPFMFERTFPVVRAIGWKLVWGYLIAYLPIAIYNRRSQVAYTNRVWLEHHDLHLCLSPFMLAERDRNWLRFLRYQRNQESEIMKDVPGWKTGTWYGEPVYFTLGDRWRDAPQGDQFIHTQTMDKDWLKWYRRNDMNLSGPKWYEKYLPEFMVERITFA